MAPEMVDKRSLILEEANRCVTSDRNLKYGEPEDNFKEIADLWSAYLGHDVTSINVAMMMVLTKVARSHSSPDLADHYIDMAGYAAAGYAVATK